jgi:hypothetical protein
MVDSCNMLCTAMEGKWPHFMDLCNNCNGGDDDDDVDDADAWVMIMMKVMMIVRKVPLRRCEELSDGETQAAAIGQ